MTTVSTSTPPSESEVRQAAITRLRKKRGLQAHLVAYVMVNLLLNGIWLITMPGASTGRSSRRSAGESAWPSTSGTSTARSCPPRSASSERSSAFAVTATGSRSGLPAAEQSPDPVGESRRLLRRQHADLRSSHEGGPARRHRPGGRDAATDVARAIAIGTP